MVPWDLVSGSYTFHWDHGAVYLLGDGKWDDDLAIFHDFPSFICLVVLVIFTIAKAT